MISSMMASPDVPINAANVSFTDMDALPVKMSQINATNRNAPKSVNMAVLFFTGRSLHEWFYISE